MKKIISALLGCGILMSGCSLSPNFKQPQSEIPSEFANQNNKEVSQEWWKDFNDPMLNLLVEEALKNNLDLAIAMQRVEQARNSWNYARSDRYPSLDIKGSGAREKAPKQDKESYYNNFSLSGVLNYEFDLWGKMRDMDRAQYAQFLAQKASRDIIKLSLIANVAQSYFGIITLNNQVEISKKTLKTREENYLYRKKEFEAGKISEIDMQQAKSQLASVKGQLQSIMMEQNAAQTSLMILLGRNAKELFSANVSKDGMELPKPPVVPVNLPSSILENRPDIEAATQKLKSANFSIGVARSAYFPTISLSGLAGYVSPEFDRLVNDSHSTWNYGGNFIANLINFGRTSANVRISKAKYEEMLLEYGKTVQVAFGEVRDGLFNYEITEKKVESLNEQVSALSRAVVLAQLRYEEGYSTYLEVLNMQNSLFIAELDEQKAKLESLSAAINLYKAFGGGWNKEEYLKEK